MYKYLKENRLKVLVIPLILYWIILFIGTTLPSTTYVDVFEISDKLKHLGAYLILAVLLGLNLHFQEKWQGLSKFYLSYTFIICITYGVLDEIHQIFVPNRSAEFFDWIADLSGTLIGILVIRIFINIIRNKNMQIETNQ
ncbi:MAG: VanZ family protein [Ignavibacteriae bacterium]|nr:VanZ family protein [Ignavibacteriota bacterium]